LADILIIEDDAQSGEALGKLLAAKGHEVRTAPDAGGALRRLSERQPDLILLDLGLPRVFGLDLLEGLHAEPRFADIPIAVYTGHDEAELRAAARRSGAACFIVKGLPWSETYAQIEGCLNPRGAAPAS
jgi:two-component system KDP operon response regulator KdpE